MYNSVLIPIDSSDLEPAVKSIKAAKSVTGPGGTISLISVLPIVPPFVASELPADFPGTTEAETLEKLTKFSSEQQLSNQTPVIVKHGVPYREILDTAEKDNSDLIIVASNQPGWETYLLGSTAAKVVRHAKCSVLVIR